MNLANNPYVKAELDNLQLQFGNKSLLDINDYCRLFDIGRRYASQHIRRKGIPFMVIGREIFIPITDLALFFAKKKAETEGRIIIPPPAADEMKSRRGFSQKTSNAQLASTR